METVVTASGSVQPSQSMKSIAHTSSELLHASFLRPDLSPAGRRSTSSPTRLPTYPLSPGATLSIRSDQRPPLIRTCTVCPPPDRTLTPCRSRSARRRPASRLQEAAKGRSTSSLRPGTEVEEPMADIRASRDPEEGSRGQTLPRPTSRARAQALTAVRPTLRRHIPRPHRGRRSLAVRTLADRSNPQPRLRTRLEPPHETHLLQHTRRRIRTSLGHSGRPRRLQPSPSSRHQPKLRQLPSHRRWSSARPSTPRLIHRRRATRPTLPRSRSHAPTRQPIRASPHRPSSSRTGVRSCPGRWTLLS